MIRVGVVGAGVFGGYHAQKAKDAPMTELVGIHDLDLVRAGALAEKHDIRLYDALEPLMSDVDALVIASPASTHEALVEQALTSGLHVLVEKPLALEGEAAKRLAALAKVNDRILQVGHQERFVSKAMGLFDLPERPIRISATREGLPSDRALDVSVIDDLMIHDMDLALCLTGHPAIMVEGVASSGADGRLDTVRARALLGECVVDLFADRQADARKRIMKLEFEHGEIIVDFITRQIVNTTSAEIRLDVSETVPDPLKAADEAFYAACMGQGPATIPAKEAAYAVAFAERVRRACQGDGPAEQLDKLGSDLMPLENGQPA